MTFFLVDRLIKCKYNLVMNYEELCSKMKLFNVRVENQCLKPSDDSMYIWESDSDDASSSAFQKTVVRLSSEIRELKERYERVYEYYMQKYKEANYFIDSSLKYNYPISIFIV